MERYKINQKIRKLLGLSGKQLAERVEVSKQTIHNYEHGLHAGKPLQRVIEIELDLEIERCSDKSIKKVCEILKLEREKASV